MMAFDELDVRRFGRLRRVEPPKLRRLKRVAYGSEGEVEDKE